ncbi:MAG: hypothetical protein GEU87_20150 [Alphaproteobacteria bacterium]|nr:hypothetical protein [Alphaproteobacteria bacterium]
MSDSRSSSSEADARARWDYEQKRALAERVHDQELDFMYRANEAAVTAGNHVMRALVIINGGAAVAMLAFIGHLISADKIKFMAKLAELTSPLIWFASGVASAAVGIGFAYFVNYCIGAASSAKSRHYEHPYIRETTASVRWGRATYVLQILSMLSGVGSLLLFVLGMLEIRNVVAALH